MFNNYTSSYIVVYITFRYLINELILIFLQLITLLFSLTIHTQLFTLSCNLFHKTDIKVCIMKWVGTCTYFAETSRKNLGNDMRWDYERGPSSWPIGYKVRDWLILLVLDLYQVDWIIYFLFLCIKILRNLIIGGKWFTHVREDKTLSQVDQNRFNQPDDVSN